MPNTINRAYPYPLPTADPDVPYWNQQLAEKIDVDMVARLAELARLPYKMAAGSATLSFGAGVAFITSNVALPAGFTQAPIVTVTLGSNVAANASKLLLSAYSATTTGFTIKMQTNDNTNIGVGYNFTFQWVAVQMAP